MTTGIGTGRAGIGSAPSPTTDLGVVDGLVQLSFLIQSLLGRVAAGHDVSIVQARLLGILRDREVGMVELSRILDLEKSSVTGLVDRAERRGLVRRIAVPEDRRAVRVGLTARGRTLTAAAAAELAASVADLVDGLSPAQQDRLSRLATALVRRGAQAG